MPPKSTRNCPISTVAFWGLSIILIPKTRFGIHSSADSYGCLLRTHDYVSLPTLETRPPSTSVAPSVVPSVAPMEKGVLARLRSAQGSWNMDRFRNYDSDQGSWGGVPIPNWSFQRPKRRERASWWNRKGWGCMILFQPQLQWIRQ